MSKGSGRRKTLIDDKQAQANWEAAFGKSKLQLLRERQEQERVEASLQDKEMAEAQTGTPSS